VRVTGGCHCGRIRFACEVDAEEVEICHCADCKQLSGSAFSTVVPVVPSTLRYETGQPRTYAKTADSGRVRVQSFCGDCGSPLSSGPQAGEAGVLRLRVGALDQREALIPRQQFWSVAALPWTQAIASLDRIEREV